MNADNYLVLAVLNIFGVYIIYSTIKIFHNNEGKNKRNELISFTIYYIFSNLLYIISSVPIALILFNIIAFFLLSFNYRISFRTRILLTLFTYVLLNSCEVIVALIIRNSDFTFDLVKKNTSTTIFLRISTLLLQYIMMLILNRFKSIRKNESINFWYWLCIVGVPAATFYSMCLLLSSNQDIILAIFGVVSMFLLNFLLFHVYDHLVHKAFLEKKLYIEQSECYIRQYEIIKRQSHSFEKVAHEMKDHLLNIINLVELEQNKAAIKYVQDIVSIGNSHKRYIDTGNLIIDSTLNVKIFDTELLGIELKTNLFIPTEMAINQLDIAVILGNTLDYAINKTKSMKFRYEICSIKLAMKYDKGELSIRVSNNSLINFTSKCNKDWLLERFSKNRNFTKIIGVQKILSKYKSDITYVINEEEFDIFIQILIDLN